MSNNISFRDVIQPQTNRENYETDFRTGRKWRLHEMHNLEYKLFYYQPKIRQWSGRPGFNPRSSHTKDSKMVLDVTLLSTQHYKVRRSRVKWSNPGNRVAPSPTPRCSNYWKRELSDHPRLKSPTMRSKIKMKANHISLSPFLFCFILMSFSGVAFHRLLISFLVHLQIVSCSLVFLAISRWTK